MLILDLFIHNNIWKKNLNLLLPTIASCHMLRLSPNLLVQGFWTDKVCNNHPHLLSQQKFTVCETVCTTNCRVHLTHHVISSSTHIAMAQVSYYSLLFLFCLCFGTFTVLNYHPCSLKAATLHKWIVRLSLWSFTLGLEQERALCSLLFYLYIKLRAKLSIQLLYMQVIIYKF